MKLGAVGLVIWALWQATRPRCAFVVRVAGGQPKRAKGVVTAAFLDQVREVCDHHGVLRGTVWGVIRGNRISLAFSGSIPCAGQQQLRNWWALSGWAASPGRSGPPAGPARP